MNGNDNRRDGESTPPILIATYLWSILVFHGILFYGYRALKYSGSNTSSNPYDSIIVALVLFTNYNILCVLLLSNIDGAIETEGPGVDEHGFVGQFGVMVSSSCILMFFTLLLELSGIVLLTALVRQKFCVYHTIIDVYHIIAMGDLFYCIRYSLTSKRKASKCDQN